MDNETSDTLLQVSDVTSRLKRLQQNLDEQNTAMQQQNKLISRAEMEIIKKNALVERKQTQVDQLNKKIDFATSKLGGVSSSLYFQGANLLSLSVSRDKPAKNPSSSEYISLCSLCREKI